MLPLGGAKTARGVALKKHITGALHHAALKQRQDIEQEKSVLKKWTTAPAAADNNEIKEQFGDFLGGLLLRRGIANMDSAREFFACEKLSDPLAMRDMERAAEIIREAIESDAKITIYGDYDCDGVTSTVMLYSYLEAQGAQVDFYIPDRSEGYGLNIPALKKIIDGGTELIITVDNGVSAAEEAEYIHSRGVKLVITDHHQPPQELPQCDACVNPHRADDSSVFKDLCGAGVVLKLLCVLEDEDFVMEQYADLAAIGTIGDVMPLRGENRYIVKRGLECIRTEQNLGLSRLIRAAGLSPETITSTALSFYICPRINAAGRIAAGAGRSGAAKAARLLLADMQDSAYNLTDEIMLLNDKRKEEENKIMEDISQQIASDPSILWQRVIIVAGKGWNHGVIGIACARLMDSYGKPVFVISDENGDARGSARSIDGFSIHKALTACHELLTKFGGHLKAGGFSLPADKIEEFRGKLLEYANNNYPRMPDAEICADMETDCAALSIDNVKALSHLEPFGEGNKQPLFLLKGCTVWSVRALKGGKYTSFEVESNGKSLKALTFKIPFSRFFATTGSKVDILANAEINVYNNITSVNLKVQELRPSNFAEDRFFAAAHVYEQLRRGEGCDPRLAPRVVPQDRKSLMGIYDAVKKSGGQMSAEEMCVYGCGINYCMLRITLDAFAEAKMIELEPNAQSAKIVPAPQKTDLFAQGLIARINSEFHKS